MSVEDTKTNNLKDRDKIRFEADFKIFGISCAWRRRTAGDRERESERKLFCFGGKCSQHSIRGRRDSQHQVCVCLCVCV